MIDSPLISVVVITYNSSKYVLDTLESVKKQDYSNIELIVSDDCSTDDTFDICKKWVDENKSRFGRAVVVQTEKNGGICVNYNRGLREVQGEWVKYIAGDDILLPNCISTFVSSCATCNDKIMLCGIIGFSNSDMSESERVIHSSFDELTVRGQEKYIVKRDTFMSGPTLFLETQTLRKLGGFEECYPFIEDYPLCMKYLSQGYHIHVVNDYLIRYRVYPESVSRSNSRFATSIFDAIYFYAPKAAWRNGMFFWWYHYKVRDIIRHLSGKRKIWGYLLRIFDLVNYKKKYLKSKTL